MSGIGSGYDLAVNTYSPEGRIFQVEYAAKALDNNGTALGICCTDGVVVAVEKILPSKMIDPAAQIQRIFPIDKQCGICIAGLQPDGRVVIERGQNECATFRDYYDVPIPGVTLASRIAEYFQLYTQYYSYRPLGCGAMIASCADDGPKLFFIDPSGACLGYHACAFGRAKTAAKAELEKLSFENITTKQAVKELSRILTTTQSDETRDNTIVEFEFGWVSHATKNTFEVIPNATVAKILQDE